MELERVYMERLADSTLTLKEGEVDMVELRTLIRNQLSFYLRDGNVTLRCRTVTYEPVSSENGDKIVNIHLVCEDIAARYKARINLTTDQVEDLRMQNVFTQET